MKLISQILDLLFPPKCLICGKVLDSTNTYICDNCVNDLPFAGPFGSVRSCEFVESVCFPFKYSNRLADSIKRYKFNGCKGYSGFFALKMAECISFHFNVKFDLITWVPVSKKRLQERGYDQSKILAEQIGKILDIPVVPLLGKARDTAQQSSLKGIERRKANTLGAYKVVDSNISGKKILIIDDIITSGSTISECSRTLLMAHAKIVYGAAIASAK